jgi:Bacterial Ig domain
LKPRRWRASITIGVILSLLIGIGAAGLGLWDLHKINKMNGQTAVAIDNTVPATSVIAPTTGQTLSGVFALDALPVSGNVKSVQFVANGGSSHNVLIGNAVKTLTGFAARWNTANLPNGTYQIVSIGYNTSGKSSRSPAVTVHLKNP